MRVHASIALAIGLAFAGVVFVANGAGDAGSAQTAIDWDAEIMNALGDDLVGLLNSWPP
ncbi:MAG: hypothetical protein J4N95_09195 [Chloroflexi bacterium]|nr:hypothetical protein [Chloroflexota bacterium]